MPLFARTFSELLTDSIEDLSVSTNLTRLSAGSKARAILEAFSKRLEETYDIFDINLARAFVSTAPGQFLELIGELVGVQREASRAATVGSDLEVIKFFVENNQTFGDINGGNDIIIPTGTLLSTLPDNSGILYRVIQEAILDSNTSAVFVSAEANAPGEDFNLGTGSLIFHGFTGYTNYQSNTLKVTNIHPIANGENLESDANYRFRIVNRVTEAEAANETAIRLAALSTAGVADVVVIPRYRGIGTFGLIIKSVTPTVSDALIDAVTAKVYTAQAFGDIAYIRKPQETGLAMKFTVHYRHTLPDDTLDLIEEDLETSIESYVNNLDIGEAFSVNRMIADLFGISPEITNFGESGKPVDEIFLYKESKLQDNKLRQKLLGDYYPETDERIIIEPSITNAITFERQFGIR